MHTAGMVMCSNVQSLSDELGRYDACAQVIGNAERDVHYFIWAHTQHRPVALLRDRCVLKAIAMLLLINETAV